MNNLFLPWTNFIIAIIYINAQINYAAGIREKKIRRFREEQTKKPVNCRTDAGVIFTRVRLAAASSLFSLLQIPHIHFKGPPEQNLSRDTTKASPTRS